MKKYGTESYQPLLQFFHCLTCSYSLLIQLAAFCLEGDVAGGTRHVSNAATEDDDSDGIDGIDGSEEDDATVFTSLPTSLASRYPKAALTLGEVLHSVASAMHRKSAEEMQHLAVPPHILDSDWAPSCLSVVGPYDRRTYCFTKSYGRLYAKSSGSCYLADAEGPLHEGAEHALNRTKLPLLAGRLRLFSEEELLAIAGFPDPQAFLWPRGMPLNRRVARRPTI